MKTVTEPEIPDQLDATHDRHSRRDRTLALWIALIIVGVTLVPYLWGYGLSLSGHPQLRYTWLAYGASDASVYLSWMRQSADGAVFHRNLFTTDPQVGRQFNLLFFGLGRLATLTHVPLIVVYQLARLTFGMLLLWAVWWLLNLLVTDRRTRIIAYVLVCISSGLGWLPFGYGPGAFDTPIDRWQPEAFTLLSIYLFPHFTASMTLMIGIIGTLYLADQTHKSRYAAIAGCLGLVLANIHTYDIITIVAVWISYIAVRIYVRIGSTSVHIRNGLIAGLITAPSAYFMWYTLRSEAVFSQRVSVPTLSPHFLMVLLGYGLIALFAFIAWAKIASSALRLKKSVDRPRILPCIRGFSTYQAALLVGTWALANLLVSYVPLPYQRKMLMGAHFPLAFLCAVSMRRWWDSSNRATVPKWLVVSAGVMSISNVKFLANDIIFMQTGKATFSNIRLFIRPEEQEIASWIRDHTPRTAAVQPLPVVSKNSGQVRLADMCLAVMFPGMTGRRVHAGHWGETPSFGWRMNYWIRFWSNDQTDPWRRKLLLNSDVSYLVQDLRPLGVQNAISSMPLKEAFPSLFDSTQYPFLREIHRDSNQSMAVYEVVRDKRSGHDGASGWQPGMGNPI